MQLTQGHEIIRFRTSKGLFKMLRCEYEALSEVFNKRDVEVPDWDEMTMWNEAQSDFIPSTQGKSHVPV